METHAGGAGAIVGFLRYLAAGSLDMPTIFLSLFIYLFFFYYVLCRPLLTALGVGRW